MKITDTPRNVFGLISDVDRKEVVYYQLKDYHLVTDAIWEFLSNINISSSNRRFEVFTNSADDQHIRIIIDHTNELTNVRLKVKDGIIKAMKQFNTGEEYKLYKRSKRIKKILNK